MRLIKQISVLVCALLLGACTAYSYKPTDDQLMIADMAPDPLLKAYAGTVVTDIDPARPALGSWFAQAGNDYRLEYKDVNIDSSGSATLILCLFTFCQFPMVTTSENYTLLEIYDADGDLLYQHQEPYAETVSMSLNPLALIWMGKYSDEDKDTDLLNRHKASLATYLQSEASRYRQMTAAGTAGAYRTYLQEYPGSFYYKQALSQLAILPPEGDALEYHLANAETDPRYITLLPPAEQLWFVGPQGMKIYQIAALAKTDSEALLVSQIQSGGGMYRVFNADEINALKNMGISDSVIAAMINVSTSQSLTQSDTPMSGVSPVNYQSGDSALGNQATDIAAECSKRYAALKACDQMPFGSGICRSQVEDTYSHVVCDLVDAVTN